MKVFISTISWEDRFLSVFNELVSHYDKVILFYYKEFIELSTDNHQYVVSELERLNKGKVVRELSFIDASQSYKTAVSTITEEITNDDDVFFEFSTTPRESIWTILNILFERKIPTRFRYTQPVKYGTWLSKDPGRPRILYKLGGINKLGARTTLVIIPGYDQERAWQLYSYFEPAKVVFVVHNGTGLGNERNLKKYKEIAKQMDAADVVEFNALSKDLGQNELEEAIQPYLKEYNILMASLGPKLTAIPLFQLQKQYDHIGLVYTPSLQFNEKYSEGVGDAFLGDLDQKADER